MAWRSRVALSDDLTFTLPIPRGAGLSRSVPRDHGVANMAQRPEERASKSAPQGLESLWGPGLRATDGGQEIGGRRRPARSVDSPKIPAPGLSMEDRDRVSDALEAPWGIRQARLAPGGVRVRPGRPRRIDAQNRRCRERV